MKDIKHQAPGIKVASRRRFFASAWYRGRHRNTATPLPTAGFTLIETFVAIVILTTALAGALSLAAQGFNSVDVAGNQITASFLAQDAMEYVRFARDSACLPDGTASNPCNANNWINYLQLCKNTENDVINNTIKYCYFDTTLNTTGSNLKLCNEAGGDCKPFYFDPSSGLYNYAGSGGINNANINQTTNHVSKFKRKIYIVSPVGIAATNQGEARVVVQIMWSGRNTALPSSCSVPQRNCIILQENIYNWE